jgi:hypothetical protein
MNMNMMAQLMTTGFESSSGVTKEFADFARKFKKTLSVELLNHGGKLLTFSRGHFYVSGFYESDGELAYFNVPDVRSTRQPRMLYRRVKDIKDSSGGSNHFVTIKQGMGETLINIPSQ